MRRWRWWSLPASWPPIGLSAQSPMSRSMTSATPITNRAPWPTWRGGSTAGSLTSLSSRSGARRRSGANCERWGARTMTTMTRTRPRGGCSMSQLPDVGPRRELESDPFALGGDQPDDAALLTLFREWRAGMRDIEGPRPAGETEDQYDAANGALWDIARQIYDTPAAGSVGLSLKTFMLAFDVCVDHLPSSEEPASLGKFDLAQNHYGA